MKNIEMVELVLFAELEKLFHKMHLRKAEECKNRINAIENELFIQRILTLCRTGKINVAL
jgi:hypothetical protein